MFDDTSRRRAAAALPLLAAADLQDHLMVATNDLDRLQTLLDDACAVLMAQLRRRAATSCGAGGSTVSAPAVAEARRSTSAARSPRCSSRTWRRS